MKISLEYKIGKYWDDIPSIQGIKPRQIQRDDYSALSQFPDLCNLSSYIFIIVIIYSAELWSLWPLESNGYTLIRRRKELKG